MVRSLTSGDRACYMEIEDAQGKTSSTEASFELCEQTDLIGQRVQLTRESANVLAASCQGNQDCPDRDTVNLVVAAEVVQ